MMVGNITKRDMKIIDEIHAEIAVQQGIMKYINGMLYRLLKNKKFEDRAMFLRIITPPAAVPTRAL